MRGLHQELERKDDVRRRPAPQLLARPRHKLAPPLWRRAGAEVRAVALHAAQFLGRAQRLPRGFPPPPVQLEQAVVRERGDVPQVVAERYVEHPYAQRVFRRYLRLFLQVEARCNREDAHGCRIEERWGDEQHAKPVHHGCHIIL